MDFKKWMKEAYIATSNSGKVADDWIPPKDELDALIKALDGVAVVNINEPSEGDLERINNAYREEREHSKLLKEDFEVYYKTANETMQTLMDENKRLRDALQFYADCPERSGMIENVINGGEYVSLGTLARMVLSK